MSAEFMAAGPMCRGRRTPGFAPLAPVRRRVISAGIGGRRQRARKSAGGNADGDRRDAILDGVRASPAIAPRGDRQHHRHHHRVVRFLHLRHGDRAGLRPALLPEVRSADRHLAGLCDLCGRFCRPAGRGGDFRPLRRPHRAQGGADRDPPPDGDRHLSRRLCPRLCPGRHLGCGHPDGAAHRAGDRGRRRMGRFGSDVDGVGAQQCPSRLYRRLAAMGRPGRAVPGEPGAVGVQRDRRAAIHRLGLAHPVHSQHRPGRRRSLYPPRHPRNAAVYPARRRKPGRSDADRRSRQAPAARDRADGIAAHGRAGAVLHLYRLCLHLRDDRAQDDARPAC